MESIIRTTIENYKKYGVSDKAIEAAVKALPKAAVALGVVFCISAPRRTVSVDRIATAFTNPSRVIPLTK